MTRLAMVRPFWEAMGLPVKEHGDEWLAEALTLMEGRGRTTREMAEFTDYFLSFEPVKARWDGSALTADERGLLKEFFAAMTSLSDWTPAGLEAFARSWTAERNVKMKDYAMPLRWALTGMKVSPGIFDVAVHLGRDEVKRRLSHYGLI